MNKYQKYLLYFDRHYFDLAINKKTRGDDGAIQDDKIILRQNEDIAIKDYTLYIANSAIESIFAITDKTQTSFKQEHDPVYSSPKSGNQSRFYLPIDFEHKIDSIKIVFKNNLADDLILPVEYVEADKEAYYAKQEKKRKDELFSAAAIKCSTGADLVNIYFQPCCDKYEYTEIQLYIPKDFVTVGGPGGPVQKPSSWSMIKKSKVDADEFYKSISGLANGKYSFVLTQFDKAGNVLLKTDHIEFSINSGTNAPHRSTVVYGR